MSKTLVQRIESVLREISDQRLTARQLSERIVELDPEWVKTKRARSKNPTLRDGGDEEMILQIQSEIGSNRPAIERNQNLRMTEDRPRKFYYTSLSEEEEVAAAEGKSTQTDSTESDTTLAEKDLYPLLAKYLAIEFGVHAKRIEESRSSNRNGPKGNQWLHPDLIGFEVISRGWNDTVRSLVEARRDRNTRLWSFEVKKLINRSNVREVFFQALSNSSWANNAYLVAAEVSGSATLDELRMLSEQHGVGVIQLSVSAETESSILIQARERSQVDWTAASRLCTENPDVDALFREVRVYHLTGEIHEEFWEHPLVQN